ncbi:ead/Ea22-like family protein [Enterobacter cloacae]|uniref:ead/Ea22-like family protein n=1 Tax=Enterobacter cloacae TaxID=550 RepID=UPI0029CAC019|nr:ead/Ea22-like family protein [Enterobacter cloacae]
MSNIDKRALRESANAANAASWGNWEPYKPHKGARGYEVKVGVKAVAQHCLKVDSVFIAAANPATVLALLDELEAKDRRIAELSALQGKPIAWESTTPVYVKFITDERYQRLRPGYKKWYKPYRCSQCAAAGKGE